MKMKPMIYERNKPMEVLYEGNYKGYDVCIISLGTHPTAYIENKLGITYQTANAIFKYLPHGCFTYEGEAYWQKKPITKRFLGWDYAHYCDYFPVNVNKTGRKWSTEEIYEEIVKVIDNLEDKNET